MIDPYRMIVINLISSLILACGFIVYKYIYPKKNINLFYALILISLLPIISILRKGTYESGAFSDYVKFSTSFYQTLLDGNFIPSWDAFRCGLYGCPIFLFMYIFPYYVVSLFHFVGFSFIASIKLLLIAGYILSGITMYYWIKTQYGKKAGFVASIFYLFAPFHLIDLHFRADIAHVLTFVFIPLNFLLVKKIIEQPTLKWIIFQAIVLVFLTTSHQAIAVWSFIFITCYGFLLWSISSKKKFRVIIYFILSLILGLLLSAFYWLPILVEAKYIFWGIHADIAFEKINLFFYSPWRMGFLFQGPHGELSFVIGYVHLLIFFLSLVLVIKRKIQKKIKYISYFFIFSSLFTFFMTQEISKFVWEMTPLIKNFQFSYRLLVFIAFFLATIAGIYSKYISNKKIIIICILVIFSTILNWGHRKIIPEINDHDLQSELFQGRTPTAIVIMPNWVDSKDFLRFESYPVKEPVNILEGEAKTLQIFRNTTKHEYIIHALSNVVVKENTLYFPGWTLYINNKPHPINYTNKEFPGIITFNLNKGLYKVELMFKDTPVRTFSLMVSFISWIIVAATILILSLRKMFRKTIAFKSIS